MTQASTSNNDNHSERSRTIRNLSSLIEQDYDNVILDAQALWLSRIDRMAQKSYKNNETIYFLLPCNTKIENATYKTYGIGALENGVIVNCVPDISTEIEEIKSLVDICNKEELSPIHLRDVAENFLII